MSEQTKYDVVIIGGGIGGLASACILAKEGKRVIVLEKNHQIGGNLQVFSRDKVVFDTGVHYIGALSEGQNLDRFFKYLGIREGLQLKQMEVNGADRIHFGEESVSYPIGQGYDNFAAQLIAHFPEEEKAVKHYCKLIKEVCSAFPLYNLKYESADYFTAEFFTRNLKDVISELTDNKRLRSVLVGNSLLYAGQSSLTPFYVHALVVDGYINSAYRCINGSSQIAKLLIKEIRKHGGEVRKRAEVSSASYLDQHIESVTLTTGEKIYGDFFINSTHPKAMLSIFGTNRFRKPYVSRIMGLKNTQSSFSVHLKFKPNSFPYLNHNFYHHKSEEEAWEAVGVIDENWPRTLMFSMTTSEENPIFAEAASIITYMDFEEMKPWLNSFNTVTIPGERPASYYAFKNKCENKVLDELEKLFPDIRLHIESVYSSTPLTYKDYIGDPSGSMYGVQKEYTNPMSTMIDPRTKIPNLLLTGQSINLHGVLGVTVSAFATCFHLIDPNDIMKKLTQIK